MVSLYPLFLCLLLGVAHRWTSLNGHFDRVLVHWHMQGVLQKCQNLYKLPSPSPDCHRRIESNRYELGTRPTLLKNATLWTGRISGLSL
ncbi:hypothetical protein DFS33DRAFT_1030908 [Desarmillaria ectypa]|nr:hypothetical protein DFS33DRAFT_1030908 [Desarmillaria ectypa]